MGEWRGKDGIDGFEEEGRYESKTFGDDEDDNLFWIEDDDGLNKKYEDSHDSMSSSFIISKKSIEHRRRRRTETRKGKGEGFTHSFPLFLFRFWNSFQSYARSMFLPEGYPETVSTDYLEYQKWDTIQALCSSVMGILSTQAILKGVGVGESTATAIGAAIQWIIRDGTGMLGRIGFAWLEGSNLDYDCKRWSLMRAIVGVAGGATRTAFVAHQARNNNLGDVMAKDGSQETAVNLVGMVLGLLIMPHLETENQFLIWILFLLFVGLHIYANYRAVSIVAMETLNEQRASILINNYLKSTLSSPSFPSSVLTPTQVAKLEHVLPLPVKLLDKLSPLSPSSPPSISVSATSFKSVYHSLQSCFTSTSQVSQYVQRTMIDYGDCGYLIFLLPTSSSSSSSATLVPVSVSSVKLVLSNDLPAEIVLRAFYHGHLLSQLLSSSSSVSSTWFSSVSEVWKLGIENRKLVTETFPPFLERVKNAGWVTQRMMFSSAVHRARWKTTKPLLY